MRDYTFPVLRVVAATAQVLVSLIAILAAIEFGIWQYSRVLIIGNRIEDVTWLFWVASLLIAIQLIARLVVDLHEEEANIQRRNAMRAIGDFIGEGVALKNKIYLPTSLENNTLFTLEQSIDQWEEQIRKYIYEYEPALTSILDDTSGFTGVVIRTSVEKVNELAIRINLRLIRLRELLSLIAVR